MKFCVTSNSSLMTRKIADEVKYTIHRLNDAIEFATAYSDKRVIVTINSLAEDKVPAIDKLFNIHKEIPNLYYEFKILQDLIKYSKAYQEQIREDRHIMFAQPVISWAMVMILRYYMVSDILIAEPLTFNMPDVMNGIKKEGIAVRVNPTLSKHVLATENTDDSCMNHFWVPPEYVHLYEEYVDTMELCQDANEPNREETLLRLYAVDKSYKSELRFLIKNFDIHMRTAYLDTTFFTRRINCGQRCLISKNNCHFCSALPRLYTKIKEGES